MADFCRQCSIELFGEECTPKVYFPINSNEFVWMLCEGCGEEVRVAKDGFRLECVTCTYGEYGVCCHPTDSAGEISPHYYCSNHERVE